MTSPASRRRFLRLAGVTLAGTALAGCSSSGSDGDATPTAEPTAEPTPTTSAAGGDGGSDATATDTVEMTDELTFEPTDITVSAGTTVTWENVGAIGHTVTAYDDKIPGGATYFASGGFESQDAAVDGYNDDMAGNVPKDDSYEHTFETPGTYEYYCIPHEMNGMVGTVTVE